MTKFFAALTEARDTVDVNIAAGEALPLWVTFKNVVLIVLTFVCVTLALAYLNMDRRLDEVSDTLTAREQQADQIKGVLIGNLGSINAKLAALQAGQRRANAHR